MRQFQEREKAAGRRGATETRADGLEKRAQQLEQQLSEARDLLRTAEAKLAGAEARLDETRRSAEEQKSILDQAKEQLRDVFKALASDALADSRKELVSSAEQLTKSLTETNALELDARKSAVEQLVQPLRDSIEAYKRQTEELEQKRQRDLGTIDRQYQELVGAAGALQQETAKLANALRSPHVRGRWGQITLRRAAELAGMVDHCDFYEQETAEGGRLRPDMLVRLPARRLIVLDAKVPLDAYLDAMGASTEADREDALIRHARQTRDHIVRLASKEYHEQFSEAPEFVVAFIPSDSILAAAVEKDPDSVEFALSRGVVVVTPSSFFALLRVIAHGWRQEQLAQHAEAIRQLGAQLAERLQTLLGHFEKLGGAIRRTVETYNETVGSLESRVLPSAKRFKEAGATTRDMPVLRQVDIAPRSMLLPALTEGAQEIFPEEEMPSDFPLGQEGSSPSELLEEGDAAPAMTTGDAGRAIRFACTCRVCGTTFEGTGPHSRYCSDECRARARAAPESWTVESDKVQGEERQG